MKLALNIVMYIVLFILPITALLSGLSAKNNPPKTINGIKGYRTALSMESQEAWDYANSRMADLFLKNSVYMLAIGIVGAVILLVTKSDYTNVRFTVVIIVVMIIQTLMMTIPMGTIESELRDKVYLQDADNE